MNSGEVQVEGASLPQGIAVDEAAAYFGVTESADIIVSLNQKDRLNGMGEFFSMAIDLVMQENFAFEEAAERLSCEGGEIYFLLTGPFGLVTISDPLRLYLGEEDSEGNRGVDPGIPQTEKDSLDTLSDVFNLLKLFGLGHIIGGLPLLDHYIVQYEALVSNCVANKTILLQLAAELQNATEQAKSGAVTPITVLGSPSTTSAPVPAPVTTPAPGPAPAPVIAPPPAEPAVASISPQPAFAASPQPEMVPASSPILAPSSTPASVVEQTMPAAPAFSSSPVDTQPAPVVQQAASDAFASQFAAAGDISQQATEPTGPVVTPTPASPPPSVVTSAPIARPTVTPREVAQPVATSTPVSPPTIEQQFNQIDSNKDGQLSPAEISQAANISHPEAEKMVASADSNQDGKVNHQEFTAKPMTVTPKRAPIGGNIPPPPSTGWPGQSQPPVPGTGWPEASPTRGGTSALDSVSDLVTGGPSVGRTPSNSVHHNIQSGKNCSRCGIGVEQQWRHCPVCKAGL